MRRVFFCVACLGLCIVSTIAAVVPSSSSSTVLTSRAAFEVFATKYGKSYPTDAARNSAYARFAASMAEVEDMRRRNPLATFAVNSRADQPRRRGLQIPDSSVRHGATRPRAVPKPADGLRALPPAIDWRAEGAVVPPSDLGTCGGACVTLTYTGIGAAVNRIRGFSAGLTPLSSQQLLDCTPNGECGCDSGCLLNSPFEALQRNDGLWDTAASYPFHGGLDQQCSEKNASVVVGGKVSALIPLEKHNERALMAALLQSPVGVGVYAAQWQMYMGGILADCGSGPVDDMGLLVGYNATGATPYWIVRNNWGPEWGEAGYIFVAMGNNTCSIEDDPFTLSMEPVPKL